MLIQETLTLFVVTTSIESILWNVMSRVSTDFLSVSVDDYILKVFAYSEYLLK